MGGAISPLPQYSFIAWRSDKAQGQLYLTLWSQYSRPPILTTLPQVA